MPNICHELIIGAEAKKVYQAITSQEGLAGWWTPDTTVIPGSNSIARFGFGPEYFKEMNVVELTPSHHVKWICIAGAEEWVGTAISFELQSGDKHSLLNSHPELGDQVRQQKTSDAYTLLIFHHDDWRNYTSMFAECNYTWARFLRSLKLFCETGKGRPWSNQHGTDLE
jgi:uncharacterized protein YndB with AHSA1/START domain